ncbi:MAG: NADPH-dependent 7-cyano-7-deazaguanine reductase QueF [Woeseiaceae bacterium]|nr:NADPH-dependent 7-cyano-7-deazaguanine reductase QueF [Woeseiaceae bacterium]
MTQKNPLGQTTAYPEQYSPDLLYAIARIDARKALGLGGDLPFHGTDIWNAWELAWLRDNGLPQVATAEISVAADSVNLVESKSLKLYLGSFAMTRFESAADLAAVMTRDLTACAGTDVTVVIHGPSAPDSAAVARMPGHCIDDRVAACDTYEVAPEFLSANTDELVTEDLHSDLLRSLCPVTNQPDIGSILISYRGPRIDREGLLRYIVSYRQHQDFHEACVERMFLDIRERCKAEQLTVYARYQRRGGIDINPFRSNFEATAPNTRLWRQ